MASVIERRKAFERQIGLLILARQTELPSDAKPVTIADLGLDTTQLEQFFNWGWDYGVLHCSSQHKDAHTTIG